MEPSDSGAKSLPIRVLALLEADTISGPAKSIFELAHEALRPDTTRSLHVSIARFSRLPITENALTRAAAERELPLATISERRRFDWNVVPQLQHLVGATRPDVIWSNSVKSHFLVRIAGLHRRAAWVAFHHGYTTTDLKMHLYNQLDRYSLRAADRVLTSCRAFASQLVRRGIPAGRIEVQHMPIRPFPTVSKEQSDEIRREIGAGQSVHVLLSVGRLSREKGHVDLIRAFAKIREMAPELPVRLVVVGEGPERPSIETACRALGVSNDVILTGQQSEVGRYYACADLFLMTSHSEGSPNALLEAMVTGVPVVATSVGGIPEIATSEEDALLVPKGDYQAIASAAVRILRNSELKNRLVQTANKVLLRHSPEAYFDSMMSVFKRAASDRQHTEALL